MRRAISLVLAFALLAGGVAFTFIKQGSVPRLGAMGLFLIAIGVTWLIAELRGD